MTSICNQKFHIFHMEIQVYEKMLGDNFKICIKNYS